MQLGGGGVTTGPIFRRKFWDKAVGRGGWGEKSRVSRGYQSEPEALRMSSDIDLQQTQIREGTRGEGGSSNRRGEIAAKGGRECEGLIDNVDLPLYGGEAILKTIVDHHCVNAQIKLPTLWKRRRKEEMVLSRPNERFVDMWQ